MADLIISTMQSGGSLAVFALMLLENVFPPIPSEVVLPLVGYLVSEGSLSLVPAFIAALAGAVLGTGLWFALGWYLNAERLRSFLYRYGIYIAISVDDFNFAERWFRKLSSFAVFFGRMVPTVRTVISLPAGTVRMSRGRFFLLTAAGTSVWNAGLIAAGYWLEGAHDVVEQYLDPVVNIIIGIFVGVYLFQIGRFWYLRRRGEGTAEKG